MSEAREGLSASPKKTRPSPVVVGILVLALMSVFVLRILYLSDWDPTTLIGFGEDSTAISEYGEELLGEIDLRAAQGHDGKYFFLQANDPWIAEPNTYESIDRPAYRAQRMFYPVVAGLGGLATPHFIAWSLVVVNILAMGVGTWAVSRIAVSYGATALAGLGFGLNPGLISEVIIDGAGVVASALAFCAILALRRNRNSSAVALLTMSALTREVMVVVAIGAAFFLWRQTHRRLAAFAAAVPMSAVGAWYLYVGSRVGRGSSTGEVLEIGPPLVGLLEAIPEWFGNSLDLVSGVAMFLVILVFAIRAIRSPNLVSYAFAGFIPLALVMTERVWANWFDFTRALAPLLTATILLIAIGRFEASTTIRQRASIG